MYISTKSTADIENDNSSFSEDKEDIINFNKIIDMENTLSEDDEDFIDDLKTNSHDGIHLI